MNLVINPSTIVPCVANPIVAQLAWLGLGSTAKVLGLGEDGRGGFKEDFARCASSAYFSWAQVVDGGEPSTLSMLLATCAFCMQHKECEFEPQGPNWLQANARSFCSASGVGVASDPAQQVPEMRTRAVFRVTPTLGFRIAAFGVRILNSFRNTTFGLFPKHNLWFPNQTVTMCRVWCVLCPFQSAAGRR